MREVGENLEIPVPDLSEKQTAVLNALRDACSNSEAFAVSEDVWRRRYAEIYRALVDAKREAHAASSRKPLSDEVWEKRYARAHFKLPVMIELGVVEEIRCAMGSRRPTFFRPVAAPV